MTGCIGFLYKRVNVVERYRALSPYTYSYKLKAKTHFYANLYEKLIPGLGVGVCLSILIINIILSVGMRSKSHALYCLYGCVGITATSYTTLSEIFDLEFNSYLFRC